MKLMTRFAAVGALLVLNGAMAFAQAEMKLEVPFAFAVRNTEMPAGKYYILDMNQGRAVPYFKVQHAETGKTAVAVSSYAVTRKGGLNAKLIPQVAFQCAAGNCALAAVYPAGEPAGRAFPVKKLTPKDARVATVVLPATAE